MSAQVNMARIEELIRRGPRTVPACHEWPLLSPEQLQARLHAEYAKEIGPEADGLIAWRVNRWDGVDTISEWQQQRCAVCGGHRDTLVLDHDHRTALVRGWLCRGCNGLEAGGQGPLWEAYRARPPAVLLGVEEVYYSPFHGRAEPEPDPLEWLSHPPPAP